MRMITIEHAKKVSRFWVKVSKVYGAQGNMLVFEDCCKDVIQNMSHYEPVESTAFLHPDNILDTRSTSLTSIPVNRMQCDAGFPIDW
jgi:hypothetical protein